MDVKTFQFKTKEIYKHLENAPIAFFCAEYAFDEDASMYAGGLGVLAGDFILEASDEELPFVGIGLWYGGPRSPIRAKKFSLVEKNGTPIIVEIPYEGEIIRARAWTRKFGKNVYLLLLDTSISSNSQENQSVAGHLYDPNYKTRLKQEMLLGIGGVKLLREIGINPSIYHLNEGHTAFAGLELVVEESMKTPNKDIGQALASVKDKIVATKHTIFSVANRNIDEKEFAQIVAPYCNKNNICVDDIFKLGEHKELKKMFSTTQLLLNCAGRQNGVSTLHTVFEKKAHPESILFPITNGIYDKRWQAEAWHGDSQDAVLGYDAVWPIKRNLRERLVGFVKQETGVELDPLACTVVWSRRFAKYKRPELLFSDLERLKKICTNKHKVQFIISGKAHESDLEGQKILEKIKSVTKDSNFKNKIVYLADYSVTVATELVLGADVWLNTPIRGFEACGTSGMKAGLNGALQASISDGWIDEADWTNVGFILSEEDTAKSVYDTLENEIIPLFYKRTPEGLPLEWIKRIRATQNIVESRFTTKRMLQDYLKQAYRVV